GRVQFDESAESQAPGDDGVVVQLRRHGAERTGGSPAGPAGIATVFLRAGECAGGKTAKGDRLSLPRSSFARPTPLKIRSELRRAGKMNRLGVDTIVDTARMSACGTVRAVHFSSSSPLKIRSQLRRAGKRTDLVSTRLSTRHA